VSDPEPQLWLVRHGATDWSENGRHTSYTELPLLPAGEDEARSLAPRLAGNPFALVLTSPRRRARDTARLAGFPDAVVDDDLREWDYGELEGMTTAQLRETQPGWSVWSSPIPGGETGADVAVRVRRVIARCHEAGGDALLFAHAHVLRVLTAVYLGFSPEAGAQFALDTATINVLGHEREDVTLRRWNA
jgi:broad specificity phosphatase PhoE